MLQLLCHREMPTDIVDRVSAGIESVDGGKLRLYFHVGGHISQILVPKPETPVRTDKLWTKTCFEIFLGHANMSEYIEFNLSPSRQWAAYHFSGYRQGMIDLDVPSRPIIECTMGQLLALDGEITLPSAWQEQELHVNISAVIQEQGGRKSYWALAHPEGSPDFHDRDCFIHRIKAAENL